MHARSNTLSRPMQVLISAITALFLAIGLVGTGLFVCSAPFTTEALSSAFSRWEGSAFTQEELVKAALATRDYTVGSNDRTEVLQAIYEINASSQQEGRSTAPGAPDLGESTAAPSADELELRFMLADESYVLDANALSHLDDVFHVVETARIALISLALLGFVGCVILGITSGKKPLGITLMIASGIVIALFAFLAVWVIFDFNGFFSVFHSFFFAEGTWTFSYDSLLIRMYPTEFWVGMGAVWLATTVLACIICFILGLSIKGKKRV